MLDIDEETLTYLRDHDWPIVVPGHPAGRAQDARMRAEVLREHSAALRAQARLERARSRHRGSAPPRYVRVRAQNARLALTAKWGVGDERVRIPFLCECDNEKCPALVSLTYAEYAAFGDVVYFTAPGHAIRAGDRSGATLDCELYLVDERPQA